MARSLDEIFGTQSQKKRTLDEIFNPEPAPAPNLSMQGLREINNNIPDYNPPLADTVKNGIQGGIQDLIGGVKWYGTHPGQFISEVGQGLESGLSKLGTFQNNLNAEKINAASSNPLIAKFGKQQVSNLQAQQDYFKDNPVNTVPGQLGAQIPEIPLWMAGEGALTKLAPKASTEVASKIPSFISGGLKDAATYGTIVAPTNTARQTINRENNNSFVQNLLEQEKQLPSVALGGMALRGAGKAFDAATNAGLNKLNPIRKIAPELQQAEVATNTRLRLQNPLHDVQNAYKTLPQLKLPEEPQIKLPQPEQPKISLPEPRTWINADQIQARSVQFNPLGVPKLEPKKINLPLDIKSPGENGWTSVAASIENPQSKANTSIDELIANSDQWKDKNPMALTRETWDRNIVDIAGPKEGQKIKEAIFDPIHTHEADRTRWINAENQKIKSLNLSNKESEIVQQVGEGKLNIEDIPQGMDKAKILNAVQTFRNFYDQAIEIANQSLTENGYKPVDKLKNYFPHFTGEDPLMKALGIKIDLVDLPTDINGLTHQFKPGKNWFGNFLHRTGDQTTFDAVQGFDRYIQGISKVIFHTGDIQKLRTFNRSLRMKYSPAEIQTQVSNIMGSKDLPREAKDAAIEDLLGRDSTHLSNAVADLDEFTNVLAGKKDLADRADERRFGRQIYNVASFIENRIGKNMVGVNPASWITNFIPITQSLATTNKASVAQALADTMKNLVSNDGFINRSNFLTNRLGTDILSKGITEKTGDALSAPMKWIDNFTSQVVTRAKYYEGLKQGMPPEQAMKRADEWAVKIIGDRSLGAQPTIFNQRSPLTRLFTQFQLEVNNQMSFMLKDMPREYLKNGKTAANITRLSSAIGQMAIYGWLFNNLYQSAIGRRPAVDPIGVALGFKKDMDNPNLDSNKAAGNLATNIVQQLPFVGGVLGGGRIPISSAISPLTKIPGNMLDIATNPNGAKSGAVDAGKNLLLSAAYIVPPFGGGQIKKAATAGYDLYKGGEYQGNQLKFPVAPTLSNEVNGFLFGPSTFSEARKYYDNNLRPLSEKQTQEILKSPNITQDYNKLMLERRLTTIDGKIKDLRKDKGLDGSKKQQLIQALELQRAKVKGWGN